MVKTIRPIRANAGEKARYRRRMLALIDEMTNSVEYWIKAQYKDAPPALGMATDASPSKAMQKRFREVAAKWIKKFDAAAPRIAEAYLVGSFKATDSAMRAALKDAGFAVKFTMTPAMRDAFNASLEENIGLIKSIPEQYLNRVQGSVMRGYASGRDLGSIVKDLRKLAPQNRAVLIARDQSNKANAVVVRARQLELGITEAIWQHSAGGKVPRPDHVAASGKRYIVAEGMKISGEFIFPGQLINCRCVSRSVLPTLGGTK